MLELVVGWLVMRAGWRRRSGSTPLSTATLTIGAIARADAVSSSRRRRRSCVPEILRSQCNKIRAENHAAELQRSCLEFAYAGYMGHKETVGFCDHLILHMKVQQCGQRGLHL